MHLRYGPRLVAADHRLTTVSAMLVMGGGALQAAHQTDSFSRIYGAEHLPFRVRVELVAGEAADRPTLHSYVAAQWDGEWLLLGGRTNGLHGMMGQGAFPPASANSDLWVVDGPGGRTWRRPLLESGLPAATIDFFSATNHGFVQEDELLYVAGGYGFDRAAGDYATFSALAEIDVPGLIDWIKRGADAPSPTNSIRLTESPLLKVTGGALEKSGDRFLLVFGQDYTGRYRPNFNGAYTKQVRAFSLVRSGLSMALDPASVYQSPPQEDYRRRDLNVVPLLRREPDTGRLDDEFLALAGVFTPSTGVWTVPVTIRASGMPTQPDPLAAATFKQGLQHYHCAKVTLFNRVTGENFILQFGGLSAQFKDPATGAWVSDAQVPFVHHISCLVRSPAGDLHQALLSSEFPDLRSPEGKRLYFGTNAEFLPAPGTPLLRPRIIDLTALTHPQVIGHIYGGLVSDAPNNGNSHAGAEIFAVILDPLAPTPPPLDLALEPSGNVTLSWPAQSGHPRLFEHSQDLATWIEMWPPSEAPPLTLTTEGQAHTYYRSLESAPTPAPE